MVNIFNFPFLPERCRDQKVLSEKKERGSFEFWEVVQKRGASAHLEGENSKPSREIK